MKRAVFLDRDGVINFERGDYTWSVDHFKMNPGVPEALRYFQAKGFMLIIITNQGGIAKGIYRHSDVHVIYDTIREQLRKSGVFIDDMYYCPHHPDFTKCLCRKPLGLLLERAIARYEINAQSSYFIGDHQRDLLAGHAAGVKSIQIPSNSDLRLIIPQVV